MDHPEVAEIWTFLFINKLNRWILLNQAGWQIKSNR